MSLRYLFKRKPRHINVKYIDPNNVLVVIEWYGKKQIVVLPEAMTYNVSTAGVVSTNKNVGGELWKTATSFSSE